MAIREAGLDDIPALGILIDAMDRHYRDTGVAGIAATEAMLAACLRGREGTRFAIADQAREPAGLACFVVIRPGHRTEGLIYLKDLFVRAEWRGQGIGAALLGWLGLYARDHGIGRVELITSPDNEVARRLYRRMGGEEAERVLYRFAPSALAGLAEG